ncbi:MAG: hypothetical protein AB8B50_17290 [Pirellulaceae bacterium]
MSSKARARQLNLARQCPRLPVHCGLAATELLVAAVLFLAGVSLVAHTSFKAQRIQMDGEHYRVAVDYLASVLEDVDAVATEQREGLLEQVAEPDWLENRLGKSTKLSWSIEERDSVQRVELRLGWARPGDAPAVVLTGVFLDEARDAPSEEDTR